MLFDDDANSLKSIVVICTKDRPDDVVRAVSAVLQSSPACPNVLISDSSESRNHQSLVDFCEPLSSRVKLLSSAPGLARQRNASLEWIAREHRDVQIVHFIDDDTVVSRYYFGEIEKAFFQMPTLGGASGVVIDQSRPRYTRAKSVFLLYSAVPGIVLPSGRNTIGHYPGTFSTNPTWLPGCCMSYRRSAIQGLSFDSRLVGYSWGEDFDFSFRVSLKHPLTVVPTATVRHLLSSSNRLSSRVLARERTFLLHRWVRENRAHGMRVSAFWWSVLGEILFKLVDSCLARNRHSAVEAYGIVEGCAVILSRRANSARP